ncbi:MAG: hypothetical protein HC899_35480 [Leptolyngbyaceae cyanobacterium SM1_4_3]|nr:hypothetical protein [Leptolyngbyaceae cyanobacterium SM1_4_3]
MTSTLTKSKIPVLSSAEPLLTPAAVDVGNHETKLAIASDVAVIESAYAEVINDSEVGDIEDLNPGSAFVRYLSGTRDDLIGKKWLAGGDARVMFPETYQRVVDYQNNQGKVRLGLQLLLASIEPPKVGNRLEIVLTASLPDVALLSEAFKDALLGIHHIERNGITFTVLITAVEVYEEGTGAFLWGLAQGLFPQGSQVATVDIGGGTVIIQGFTAKGKTIPKTRDVTERGVNDLALAIARDDRFRAYLGKHADPSLVLDGIRNGSFKYGGKGFNFATIYSDHHRVWVQTTVAPALRKLQGIQDQIAAVLLIGGGSFLVQNIAKGSVHHCSAAQTVHVQGLLMLARRLAVGGLTNG